MTRDEAKDEALRMLEGWKPKPSWVCTCRHPSGKLRVMLTRRWPFVHVWRSRSHCMCEINAILEDIILPDPCYQFIAAAVVQIALETGMQAPGLPEPDAAAVRQRGRLSLRKVWEGAKRLLWPGPGH